MKTLFTTLLITLSFLSRAQECQLLMPDNVKVMGMNRTEVDFDDVETVTLPIVFHVVHTGVNEANNISDEQVLSQLDVLNEEFLDSKIQFCLAARDPEGNPTSGVTRYDAGWNDEYVEHGVSNSNLYTGWSDYSMKNVVGCWNPDDYINYYIVSEINQNDGQNGTQGYAYLGPTNDCRDGVVVLYNAHGNVGELKEGRTLGYTGVHELGHHLSLWHTFSNTSSCSSETNCDVQGDMVCDTPPTLTNTGCIPVCSGALVENFMDYSNESCKESFTVGQSVRMHEMLQGPRASLTNSISCVPVVDYDVSPYQAFYEEQWCSPTQDIWIDVVNQGNLELSVVDVYLYSNGNEYVETLYDVAPGLHEVLFESVDVSEAQMFEVQTVSSQDEYPDNDYAYWPIEIVNGELLQIIIDADGNSGFVDWQLYDEDGEVVISDNLPSGGGVFEYNVCLFDGCYEIVVNDLLGDGFCQLDWNNDGVCDFGATSGVTGYINGEVVFSTEFGEQFYSWDSEVCVEIQECPLDYDGNGTIGNGDIIIVLSEWGCVGNCATDPNNDGIISVLDLLYFLTQVGPCPVEQDYSVSMVKDLIVASSSNKLWGNKPKIYDVLGRPVSSPIESLPTGVYILKWKSVTKKVFVQ